MDDSAEPIRMPTWLLLNTVGITVFVFGLLLWGYSVTIQLTQPWLLTESLTHHAFPLLDWRIDDLGIIGFASAPLGFFTWMISRPRLSGSQHEKARPEPPNLPSHGDGTTDPTPVTSQVTSANGPLRKTERRRPRRSHSRPPHRR